MANGPRLHFDKKYVAVGSIVFIIAMSFRNNSYLATFLYPDFDVSDPLPTVGEKYTIFYNAYVNPDNAYLSLGIIGEQLAQWQASRYANATLYYTHLGDSSKAFPCPSNTNCTLLMQKPSGGEEETLQKVYEFCQENPDQNVIYLHSKGSFHINDDNNRLRNLITLAALSDECYEGLHSLQCNICSARFSPLPHWHSPGNMWTAKCSYIKMLYPIMDFEPEVVRIFGQYMTNCTFCPCTNCPDYSVGTGRYANEHWVHTHPQVNPCDVYANDGFNAGYPKLDDILPPFSLDIAPRNFSTLQGIFIPGPQIRLSYRLYELQQLYW
jgi:hypothetical protein